MGKHDLPFKVGQLAESKSLLLGYRGAWFRCKITHIRRKCDDMVLALEFYDFPDEKIEWSKVYQKGPVSTSKRKELKRQLMVRPCFPPIYRESQMPAANASSEVVVIVADTWKVGDLVDWWTNDCYWSGRVTEILGDEKVRIDLLPPPLGEGLSYEVFCKDLRPSLDWSPKYGWTVPIPMDGENSHPCAWLINKPANQASSLLLPDRTEQMGEQHLSTTASKRMRTPETNMAVNNGIAKNSCSDGVSSSHTRNDAAEMAGTAAGKDQYCNGGSSEKLGTDGSMIFDLIVPDSLESSILDLEELTNRVKWLKDILQFGMPLANARWPQWKFLEQHPSSTTK